MYPSIKIIADENIPFVKETFNRPGELKTLSASEISVQKIRSADILLVRSATRVNKDLLNGTKIKFVGSATSGLDHIDKSYLKRRKIKLVYAPGANANAVAEYVIAALLSLAKRKNFILSGKKIGIIGVGNAGKKVAEKCQALGMKTLLNDPPLSRRTKDKKYLPIEALFKADIISLHIPLTYRGLDPTYNLVNKNFLKKMKNRIIFINTSRGPVVDEQALLYFMKEGKFESVVLDVWANEPEINIELLKKVDIGTPHIAGYSLDGKVKASAMLYRAMCRYLHKRDEWSPLSLIVPLSKDIIKIDCSYSKNEEIIGKVINTLYDPETDDRQLRKIIYLAKKERRKYFESLRKGYPVRREFHNIRLLLKNCSRKLIEKFKKLGFNFDEPILNVRRNA